MNLLVTEALPFQLPLMQPRRPLSGYNMHFQDCHREILETGFKKRKDVLRCCAIRWKLLPTEEKEYYRLLGQVELEKYKQEKIVFEKVYGTLSRIIRRKKRPLNAPKRTISAFMHFRRSAWTEMRSSVLEIAEMWRKFTPEEKQPYMEMARIDKERYAREKRLFLKRKTDKETELRINRWKTKMQKNRLHRLQQQRGEMAGKALKAIVFVGSVRDGRNATRVSKFVTAKLQEAKYDVEVWDPQDSPLPIWTQPLQFYPDPSKAPQVLRDMNEKIKAADAFVILTADYNRQMPPALTNLIDYFPSISYAFKSSAIVCYSIGSGECTAAAQARTLMVEMGAPPIPYVFCISDIMKSLDESGNVQNECLHEQATKMITQLDWYANAMRNHREKVGLPNWDSITVSV